MRSVTLIAFSDSKMHMWKILIAEGELSQPKRVLKNLLDFYMSAVRATYYSTAENYVYQCIDKVCSILLGISTYA